MYVLHSTALWYIDAHYMAFLYCTVLHYIVWGHSLTQYKKSLIKTAERLTLVYYAPMWKTTPTASLQVILNKKTITY